MDTLIFFNLKGRFAHFLKAEAGASALSYPLPPRTVILGIVGAILGLEKDYPQILLEPMQVTLAGSLPSTHWHRIKLRKDPPELLNNEIHARQKAKESTKSEAATLIRQEWLINPEYTIGVNLPAPYHQELHERLVSRRWFFSPYLGLSEMPADVKYLETVAFKKLSRGSYAVQSMIPQDGDMELDINNVYEQGLSLHLVRMPRTVTTDRVFTHRSYIVEKNNLPIIVKTREAYLAGGKVLMFL